MNIVFKDITNILPSALDKKKKEYLTKQISNGVWTRNKPYSCKVLSDDYACEADSYEDSVNETLNDEKVLKVVVRFKCHSGEYASAMNVVIGEYVVVEGDRGKDIGVVMSTEYVNATGGPTCHLLGSATQEEVDIWAGELKRAENEALAICRNHIATLKLSMSALQAEYQFDRKKLTIYYTAPDRVTYDVLTKELFRVFECRIWLAKVGGYDAT